MGEKINDGGPAFPVPGDPDGGWADPETCKIWRPYRGMTLRDWFAGQADVSAYQPYSTLLRKLGRDPSVDEMARWIARVRLIEADAILSARDDITPLMVADKIDELLGEGETK